MKAAERILCMVLAAVMLVTTVPVSAQHFDKTSVERTVAQQTLKNADPVKAMRARYQEALQIVEKREVSKQDKERAQKEADKLYAQAEELAQTEEYLVLPEPQRVQAAFSDIAIMDLFSKNPGETTVVLAVISETFFLGVLVSGFYLQSLAAKAGEEATKKVLQKVGAKLSIIGSTGAGVAGFVFSTAVMSIAAHAPIIASMSPEETCRVFSENPFMYMAKFEKSGAADSEWAMVAGKCPAVTDAATKIAYYSAIDPTNIEIIKGKLYPDTKEGRLTIKDRGAYWVDFASRLEAQAQAKTSNYAKGLHQGLAER